MKTNLTRVACAFALSFVAANAVNAASISGQGTWETTLQGRDLDGNLSTFEAYYDTVLNISWLANTNYGVGSIYDDVGTENSGTTTDGYMSWANANAWAANLNINGVTGWRLPKNSPIDGTTADDENISHIGTEDYGYNVSAPGTLYAGSTASELAHMFYNTLGDKSYYTTSGIAAQAGSGLSNTGPFSNLHHYNYWSATEYAPDTSDAWYFDTQNGGQHNASKAVYPFVAWAVHPGDVATASTVPVPAAAWLFGSGLLGLIGAARRKSFTC